MQPLASKTWNIDAVGARHLNRVPYTQAVSLQKKVQISLRSVTLVSAALSREDLSGCAHGVTFLNVEKKRASKNQFY